MNEDYVLDIIQSCTKIFNDIKKKNPDLDTSLTNCLNNLNSLKENLSQKNKNKDEEILSGVSVSFIEAAKQIIKLKYTKFFYNILILIKKFIVFNLFSTEKSNNLIEILKDIYINSKANDECQNKILEILQTLMFTPFFQIKYDILSNIYILVLRSFVNTSNSKNNFKNPIRLLFTTITENVYKSNNLEIIIQITILIFSWYNLSLKKNIESLSRKSSKEKKNNNDNNNLKNNEFSDEIDDKLKEEINLIIKQKKNNIYIQCLSLELITQGFIIIHNKIDGKNHDQFDVNFLNSFIKEKVLKSLSLSIDNIKNNNSTNEEELNYLLYLKLCRFIKIIIFSFDINYDILEQILELINANINKINWKINLSFEFLSNIIINYELLQKIYNWKKELLISIFSTLNNFTVTIELLKVDKDDKKVESIISNFMKKKEFDNNKIYIEGDEIKVLKEQNKKFYKNLLNECLQNLIDSLIKNDKLSKNIEKEEIFNIICDNLKDIIFKLLKNEINKNINNQNDLDNDMNIYMNYIQNMIVLFNNLKMIEKRDEYFKKLCELALEFQDENSNNINDKNILLVFILINLMKNSKSLNKDILATILQTIEDFNQKYNYVKLREYSKNDLDKIIKDINNQFDEYNKSLNVEIPIKKEENTQKNEKNEKNEKNIEENDKKDKKENDNNDIKNKDNDNDKKENNNNISDNHKNENINKLCQLIDKLFIDTKNIDLESLKSIIEALSICIDLSIAKNKNNSQKKNDMNIDEKENTKSNDNKDKKPLSKLNSNSIKNENEDTFNNEIIFYFSKILTITLLNVDNIYILFDPFIEVINKLIDNKLMIDFSIDILCSLIPEVILKYEKIESNIKKNITEDNKIWINERWQKILFSPLLTLLSQVELYKLIKGKIYIGLNKIIQQSGHYIDLFGWESIIQSCFILLNYDIENSFLPIKRILNNYNIYLSLFNIIPIMKILELFVFNNTDRNVCFSSIELFWSCANLVDDFKKEKRIITEKQKPIFDDYLKEKDLKEYCDEIYIKLFSYLISINNDDRIDIRKAGLNVFTEIFVSKMNTIKHENTLKILNDIFFKVFSSNAKKFISNNKNKEIEQTLQSSILAIIKILKEFFNEHEEENQIFDNYLNEILDIIPFGSTQLNSEILKTILEIKIKKNDNIPKIITKIDIYFKILLLINDFIKSPNFTFSQFNKVPIYKLFHSILSYLSSIFWDNKHEEIFSDDNIKNIFIILNTLFESMYSIETKLLEIKPRRIIEIENEIFSFLEKIPVQNNVIFNYLIDKMNFDFKNPHSEAIYRRSLECFQNNICKNENNNNNFGLSKEQSEIIKKLIEKITELINQSNKNEFIECLMNTSYDKNDIQECLPFKSYLISFIKIIDQIFNNYLIYKEKLEDKEIEKEKKEIINNIYDLFLLVLVLFETIFKQSINDFKSINKIYKPMISEIYYQMNIESVNFIINKLIFYILYILGEEDQKIFKPIENKLIEIIRLSCGISNNYTNKNNLPSESLNQICINELFKICKYQSVEEILNSIKDNKKINPDKYIENHIKIGKICSTLLIQKIIEILKKFREDEIKSGDMPLNRKRIKEIVDLLKNIKNFEMFPNINKIEHDDNQQEKNEEKTVFDIISKTKKIHLFYIQPILNDFIDTKEKEIKNLVKEIFQEITNIIGMPKLNDFNK